MELAKGPPSISAQLLEEESGQGMQSSLRLLFEQSQAERSSRTAMIFIITDYNILYPRLRMDYSRLSITKRGL